MAEKILKKNDLSLTINLVTKKNLVQKWNIFWSQNLFQNHFFAAKKTNKNPFKKWQKDKPFCSSCLPLLGKKMGWDVKCKWSQNVGLHGVHVRVSNRAGHAPQGRGTSQMLASQQRRGAKVPRAWVEVGGAHGNHHGCHTLRSQVATRSHKKTHYTGRKETYHAPWKYTHRTQTRTSNSDKCPPHCKSAPDGKKSLSPKPRFRGAWKKRIKRQNEIK